MNKNKTNKNRKQVKQTPKYDHPGRPMYNPKWPRAKEFTFLDWCEAQGMKFDRNGDYVKGSGECTPLTLRKFLNRDKASRGHSVLVQLDATADPNSKKGLGRKAYLYSLRNRASVTRTRTPKASTAPESTNQTPTADALEATKATLLADTSVPVAAPAPAPEVTPIPAPAPAPETAAPAAVAETPVVNETPAAAPAPVAQESANAETATPTPSVG